MITSTSQIRIGFKTVVTAVSSLSGVVYYFWYLDGAYMGFTTSASYSFVLKPGEQSVIDVLDSNDPDFDPVTNAPAGYPARRTLVWTRSIDADVHQYRVEQRKDAGAWVELGYVYDDPAQWLFRLLSPRLDDLAEYEWRVVPMDLAGNDGTPVALGAEKIVRRPDAPNFTAELQPSTEILFEAA